MDWYQEMGQGNIKDLEQMCLDPKASMWKETKDRKSGKRVSCIIPVLWKI